VEGGITGEKWPVNLACDSDSHVNHKVLLHAANLRHGTDGFTSHLFSPLAGFEPAILGTIGQHGNHETTEAATSSVWRDCRFVMLAFRALFQVRSNLIVF
jgi:hypothetical protein